MRTWQFCMIVGLLFIIIGNVCGDKWWGISMILFAIVMLVISILDLFEVGKKVKK